MSVVSSEHFLLEGNKRGRDSISLCVVKVLGRQFVFFPSVSAHLSILSFTLSPQSLWSNCGRNILCHPSGSTGKNTEKNKENNCFVFADRHVWSRPWEYQSASGRSTEGQWSWKGDLPGTAAYHRPCMSHEDLELMTKWTWTNTVFGSSWQSMWHSWATTQVAQLLVWLTGLTS